MTNEHLSIIPIGGVGEIGSNMTLLRGKDEDIIIDCGLLFPYEECFNINYLVPDFSIIDPKRVKAIIVTHGHEDHIGSIPHLLLKFPNITVYCSSFTLSLIKRKIHEHNILINYINFTADSHLIFQNVEIFPIHVNHSIPETFGLIFTTKDKEWGGMYISDFKVDLNAVHEKKIDLSKIKTLLSGCKKLAYFLDSTNILNDGKTSGEGELEADLEDLILGTEKRVFVTLFASNVHRMMTISRIAQRGNRKVVLMGRSLQNYIEAAFEAGISDLGPEYFYRPDQVKGSNEKLLILISGCQGDFLSALRRFSFGEDSNFKPTPNDMVIFSSKVIPGNEKKISRIYNKLTEFGATVVTAHDKVIHSSGHPGKKDLCMIIDNLPPDYYFPIHGESYLLKKHYDFIKNQYPSLTPFLIFNYHEVVLRDETIKINKIEPKEPHLIHGKMIPIEKSQISQRRKMATQGAIFISFNKKSSVLEISLLGLPLVSHEYLSRLKQKLMAQITNNLLGRDDEYFKNQIKISTRQFFNNILGYKPVTEVHLH